MTADLGTSTLNLDVNVRPLEQGQQSVNRAAKRIADDLEKVAAFAKRATETLHGIQMRAEQALESGRVSDRIKRALSEIGYEAAHARADLERVKLDQSNASETEAAGDRIDRKLKDVTGNANEARRALEGARLAGIGAGGGGGGRIPVSAGNPGSGFGPFGSGFGRIGLLGTAVGGAALLGPAAGPGALGLLAGIPTLAAAGAGALGTLALGFVGVGKAISGDLKAFKALQPAQQQFVLTVRSLKGWVDQLRETAGESMFPGLTKGLKEALSPGLLGVIAKAVRDFGKAIGDAGEQWGRYFGSAQFLNIFEPLMQTGVGLLTKMSGAALDLFDALGVLGRAAIPLVNWLSDAVVSGSRLIDTFTRAQDASGGLGHALDEAQVSLRLVANLGESLLRVVAALGEALYPVSKIAVKDLTDGLNALAGIIDRNQAKIQEIVGGALAALRSTVEVLAPLIGGLAKGLDRVAEAIGGWQTAFQVVIGGYLLNRFAALSTSILGVGTAAGEAGAAGKLGLLGTRLGALATMAPIVIPIVLGVEVLMNKDKVDSAVTGWLKGHGMGFLAGDHSVDISQVDSLPDWAKKQIIPKLQAAAPKSKYFFTDNPPPTRTYSLVGTNRPEIYIPEHIDSGMESLSTDPFGAQPPWTKNLGPKGPKPSLLDLVFPQRMQASLSDARANAAGGSIGSLQRLLAVAKKSLDYLDAEHRTGKKLVVLNRERATIAALIASTEQKIYRLQIAIPQGMQNALANAKAALTGTTSSPLSAESLNARAAALAKIVTAEDRILDRLKAQHVTGKALAALQKEIGQNETARGKAAGQLRKVALQAGLASEAERINGIASGPTMSGQIASLRQRERSMLDKVLRKQGVPESKIAGLSIDQLVGRATPFLSKASQRSLGILGKDWQFYLKHNFLPDSVIDNVRTRLQQFNDTITASFGHLNLSAVQVARRQEQQFLQAFQGIVSSYAPNATPAGGSPAVLATHLYDIKHETRQQTKAMRKIADRVTAAASDYVLGLGVFG